MRFRQLPGQLQAYVAAHGLLLPPLFFVALTLAPPQHAALVAVLLLSTAIFSTWKVELAITQGRITPTFAVVCLALLLDGLGTAVLCAATGAIVGSVVRSQTGGWKVELIRTRPYLVLFNLANCTMACTLAGLLYRQVAGTGTDASLIATVGLILFTSVYFLVNTLGISRALAWRQKSGVLVVWKEHFAWTFPGFFASASVAAGIQIAFGKLGFGSLLLLGPLYWVYYSYRDHMQQLKRLNDLNEAVITSLATAIEAKDQYTCSHINRVQLTAVALGRAAGLDGPELEAVRIGALVHDIGKLGIPDHILSKPGKLTTEEFRRIQSHVTIGAQILAPVPFSCPVVDVVLSHHERWDGNGYPHQLGAENIPIGGRIIAIADVYDALTSDRPYRRAMEPEAAVQILREGAGKQFDPRLVELFEGILPKLKEEMSKLESESGEGEKTPSATDPGSPLRQISQSASEVAAACSIGEALEEQTSLGDGLDLLVTRTLSLLAAESVVVYLKEPGGHLLARATGGKYADRLQGMVVQLGEGVAGTVLETGAECIRVSAAPDVARRFKPEETVELSTATVLPLVHGSEVFGVLAVYTMAYTGLPEHHTHALRTLAARAAPALHGLLRQELSEGLAFTDPLTGLPNSRSLERHLQRLTAEGAGSRQPFSLLMLDLDGFKQVNDALGHLQGDELLRTVGARLTGALRSEDLVCRYAGDEFVVLLARAGRDHAEQASERLRMAVETIPEAPIRVSVGIATYPEDGPDGPALLHAADMQMYRDKSHRRTTGADSWQLIRLR